MKTKATIAGILLSLSSVKAEPVTDKLLVALAWAESRHNPNAEGKNGEHGLWQMRWEAVHAVYQWRRSFGDTECSPSWSKDANEPSFARDWLLLCNIWFFRQTGRMPTRAELICIHNAPQLFKKRNWNVNKMPAATKRLVREVEARMK